MANFRRRPWQGLVLGLWALFASSAQAESLRLYSLNLHAYHPTGEANRSSETRDGRVETANSDIYFFEWDELRRGHSRRVVELAKHLVAEAPEVVVFQEVTAGSPTGPKDCATFENPRHLPLDARNSAFRIQDELRRLGRSFNVAVACRGNLGWTTSRETFAEKRILGANGRVVFDFGANPYPNGMVVEGFAVLARAPWKILETRWLPLKQGGGLETFFVQLIVLEGPRERRVAIVNVHLGHKVRHFEQAVALQNFLREFRAQRPDVSAHVVAGDLNALLYRPRTPLTSDVSTAPWEGSATGHYDFRIRTANDEARVRRELERELQALDASRTYKPWAALPPNQRITRIRKAVDEFIDMQKSGATFLTEILGRPCVSVSAKRNPTCERADRIDQIWISSELRAANAGMRLAPPSWSNVESTLSDHPAIRVDLTLP